MAHHHLHSLTRSQRDQEFIGHAGEARWIRVVALIDLWMRPLDTGPGATTLGVRVEVRSTIIKIQYKERETDFWRLDSDGKDDDDDDDTTTTAYRWNMHSIVKTTTITSGGESLKMGKS